MARKCRIFGVPKQWLENVDPSHIEDVEMYVCEDIVAEVVAALKENKSSIPLVFHYIFTPYTGEHGLYGSEDIRGQAPGMKAIKFSHRRGKPNIRIYCQEVPPGENGKKKLVIMAAVSEHQNNKLTKKDENFIINLAKTEYEFVN